MKKLAVIIPWQGGCDSPYPQSDFISMVENIKNQIDEETEIIIVSKPEFKNLAEMFNSGLKAAFEKNPKYVMLVDCIGAPVMFRKDGIKLFLMTAERNQVFSMIYSDYATRISTSDDDVIKNLLPYHKGMVRDSVDFGKVLLFLTQALQEIGMFNEKYKHAYMYDFRLRASEIKYYYDPQQCGFIQIGARWADGCPYTVLTSGKKFDVFDYLKAGKEAQLELEDAFTEHLKRIGAYLKPGFGIKKVTDMVEFSQEEKEAWESGKNPLFSVVSVFHKNREEFVTTAVNSVQNQTLGRKVEHIIVVNATGDSGEAIVKEVKKYMPKGDKYNPEKPDVTLITTEINNIGFCLNLGLEKARGMYYLQLDSDDQLTPDAAEKVLKVYESDPSIGMVIGSYDAWEKNPKTGEISPVLVDGKPFIVTHDEWTKENGRNNHLRVNGAGAPRSAYIKILGRFGWFGCNDDLYSRNYGEDYDLVSRVAEESVIGRVLVPIYKVVRHAGGTDHCPDQNTIDLNDSAKDEMRRRALERRQEMNLKIVVALSAV